MRHLYITDLDGTLLGSDSRISARSAGILTMLAREGTLVSIATARTAATVEPLFTHADTRIPMIVLTGAAMWDRASQRYINPILLEASQICPLSATFLSHGINPFIYTLSPTGRSITVRHKGQMTAHEQNFYLDRRDLPLKEWVLDAPDTYTEAHQASILFLGIGEQSHVMQLASTLRSDPGLSVSAYTDIFNPTVAYIEVFHSGVSKAAAVRHLARMTGADTITVYGDNLNDLPMFSIADESVAVSNAMPEVKARATRIIGPNTTDSVALDILASSRKEQKFSQLLREI